MKEVIPAKIKMNIRMKNPVNIGDEMISLKLHSNIINLTYDIMLDEVERDTLLVCKIRTKVTFFSK